MKEELLKLYDEYLEAFTEFERKIYQAGGSLSKAPSFRGFMEWLKNGYID